MGPGPLWAIGAHEASPVYFLTFVFMILASVFYSFTNNFVHWSLCFASYSNCCCPRRPQTPEGQEFMLFCVCSALPPSCHFRLPPHADQESLLRSGALFTAFNIAPTWGGGAASIAVADGLMEPVPPLPRIPWMSRVAEQIHTHTHTHTQILTLKHTTHAHTPPLLGFNHPIYPLDHNHLGQS